LNANNIDSLSYTAFVDGIKDVLKKSTLKFDDNTCNTIINTKLQEMASKGSKKEKEAGEKFLAANKKKVGVTTTASGLQYEVVTMGTGVKPTSEDTVVCHYAGTLVSGKEFDNSYKRGEPISFPVTGVIKGWTEALQLMPKGSKWKLYIPSELGYGDRGAGGDIPGGSALIFEVELIDIKVKQ
jgi:FKBP-type peptidyl-prolyl cis-trans isomerase FklB